MESWNRPGRRPTPWVMGLGWGFLLLLGLPLVRLVTKPAEDSATSFETGRILGGLVGVAVLAGGAVWLVTMAHRRLQSRLVATVVALVAAIVGYLGVVVVPEREEQREAEEKVATAELEPAGTEDRTLVAAGSFPGFRVIDDPEVRARRRAAVERLAAQDSIEISSAEVVYQEYAVAGGRVLFQGLNATGTFATRLERSSPTELRDFLARELSELSSDDLTAVDPGPLGGVMSCSSDTPTLPADVVLCIWVDSAAVGTAAWFVPGLGVERAGEATRLLRDGVTEL